SGFYGTLAYDREFGNNHLSTKLSHFYSNKDHDNWIQDQRFTNTVLGLKYDFNDKIYTEANIAYMGTNKLPKDTRFGIFPTFGAAWIVSEENFIKENNFLNYLKLKASYGVLGYDRSTDYYLYENRWNTNGNVQFNERNNTSFTQTNLQSIGNPNLDWEKSREFNIGIEALISNNKLGFEINYFHELRYDIIQSPGYRYSVASGNLFPQVNQGETLNRGVEAMFTWKDVIGEWNYSIGGNFIYSKNKILKTSEIIYPESQSFIKQTGRPSDTYFGYVSEGLFTSQEQIDNHVPQTFGDYGVGSIAYRDLNNDGVIDNLDRKALGNSFPRTSLGVNFNLNYHRFNLFVLGTAELGVDNMRNNSYYWNYGEGKYSVIVNDRYHRVNNPGGKYPALTTTAGVNNFRNSDYWIQSASFFRLKNVELSYTIPSSSFIKAYKIFTRGTNLLVATENGVLDPEGLDAGVNNYPIFRTLTGGLSVKF
ncbi:MAG: TonB-dependent receptor, partial [Flavobacteriaceae bacterium]|nr:TonB-dependent receptor [Flavobacteriaceae bacterium]